LELQSVLTSLGIAEGKSLKKCEEMIKGVDLDGNGKVDFKEFKKMMSSHWN
jgi:calcium-binding protein CML